MNAISKTRCVRPSVLKAHPSGCFSRNGQEESSLKGISQSGDRVGRNYHKVLIEASSSFVKNGCPNMSAAIAFYAILSTIPLIFIFVAGLGFVFEGADKPMASVLAALEGVMPSLAVWLKNEVAAVESKKGIIGGFGLIFMLWSFTLFFSSLEFSFTRIFHVENRRSFIRSKLF